MKNLKLATIAVVGLGINALNLTSADEGVRGITSDEGGKNLASAEGVKGITSDEGVKNLASAEGVQGITSDEGVHG